MEKKPTETKKAEKAAPEKKKGGMLALVLIRGLTGTKTEIRATLDTLRIRKKHVCVVVEDNPSYRASALKCKDYITFGEINEETYKQLVEKRGEKQPDGKLKKFFCLHPPRGGFERKGIKKPFIKGGALGYRGDKINALIKKML